MNKTKYNQLREEIIKANKDILELKFGCVVYRKNELRKYRVIANNVSYGEDKIYLKLETIPQRLVIQSERIVSLEEFKKDFKILGRDIQLEDCLIAIPEEKNIYVSAWTGLFSIWSRALNEMVSQHINWTPNKPLRDQGDETLTFLADLLL